MPAKNCPICHKPAAKEHAPFCCKRCAEIDLGRWFTGSYAVAAEEQTDENAVEESEDDQRT